MVSSGENIKPAVKLTDSNNYFPKRMTPINAVTVPVLI